MARSRLRQYRLSPGFVFSCATTERFETMKFRPTFVFALAALFLPAFASDDSDSDSDHVSAPATNGTLSAICYNLDGSAASDHVPCHSGDVVNCCNSGDICLSNGLCFQQGDHGMVLSRGSCTDHSWGAKCYAPCSDYQRSGSMPIVNVGFDSEEPQYCCGSVTVDEDDEDVSCEFGDGPFSIPRGTAIPGVAGLADHTSENDDHDDDNDHGDKDHGTQRVSPGIAVALGVGIPIGLLIMGGVLWAIWERRRRQLRIEEEDGRSSSGMTLTTMKMPGLHHRYGPVPSPIPTYSGRATPTGSQSAFFHPVHQSPLSSPPNSPPQSPPREQERGRFHLVDDREDSEGERGRL
ncbi:hypothetical protein BJX63DRAFT_241164 [Aspergillus granulosus]|uniref:Mid2 domain-containing protein n=1 Tax=Aspergillus granulosus TaxID=176169 RepID=A0ABR4HB24_9EURO